MLHQLIEKRSVKIEDNTIVYFVDDVFTVKKKGVKEMLRMMIKDNLNALEMRS